MNIFIAMTSTRIAFAFPPILFLDKAFTDGEFVSSVNLLYRSYCIAIPLCVATASMRLYNLLHMQRSCMSSKLDPNNDRSFKEKKWNVVPF